MFGQFSLRACSWADNYPDTGATLFANDDWTVCDPYLALPRTLGDCCRTLPSTGMHRPGDAAARVGPAALR